MAAVSDRLNDTPIPIVIRRALADPQPAPTPEPVMKPAVLARAVTESAVPTVVLKPRRPSVSVSAMINGFDSFGYDLDQVRSAAKPVPRLYMEALPRDLANVSSVAAKKRLFVQAVLPIILRVNEEIVTARWRAERLGESLVWGGRALGQRPEMADQRGRVLRRRSLRRAGAAEADGYRAAFAGAGPGGGGDGVGHPRASPGRATRSSANTRTSPSPA